MNEGSGYDRDYMAKLQEPFKPEEIEWRVGSTNNDKTQGLALAYVTNRAIQNRLDETFGVFGWKNEFHAWKNNGQLCGISIKCGEEWITKFDGADDSNMEATKGGLSDAMKRAAYQWGIGRYLYNLDSVWMPIKKQGNSYVLAKTPILPKWALPEGYEGEQTTDRPATKQDALDVFDKPATGSGSSTSTSESFISKPQQNRLFALAGYEKDNEEAIERSKEIVKELLDKYGLQSSGEIKKGKEYNEICQEAEVLLADRAVTV